jgi:hypothetical protein
VPPMGHESPRQSPIRFHNDVASAPKPAVMESPIAPITRMSLGRRAWTDVGFEVEFSTAQLNVKACVGSPLGHVGASAPKRSTRRWASRWNSDGPFEAAAEWLG